MYENKLLYDTRVIKETSVLYYCVALTGFGFFSKETHS